MRPLAPKGGNDRVYTPPELAYRIVGHFKPSGICLEPCSGKGAFCEALQGRIGVSFIHECEIDDDIDFFGFNTKVDWIVTNPPWSQFRQFLKHSMELSDNIVFLSLMNAWFMKARVRDMKQAGFGLKEALFLETPPKPWPQTGFQLAAVHIQRGYSGDMKITHQ